MSKWSDNVYDYVIDIESYSAGEQDDLLAENNQKVLSSFGENVLSKNEDNRRSLNPKNNKTASPISLLKAKMGIISTENTKNDEQSKSVSSLPSQKETEDIQSQESNNENEAKEMSLLEKLKRYTVDDKGHDVSKDEAPLYKLKSVADIIKSDSDNLIDRLSQKYNVTIDTLGKPTNTDYLIKGLENETEKPKEESETLNENANGPIPTPTFKKMSDESKQRFEKSIFDDIFPQEAENEIFEEGTADISDLDSSDTHDSYLDGKAKLSDTATIRFTPIKDEKGNTGRINISSSTKVIDIQQEIASEHSSQEQEPAAFFEASDFDLFAPRDEITDLISAKNTAKKFAYKRRRIFLSTLFCLLCTFITSLFLTPILSDKVISSTKSVITFCSCLLFASILANIDMFADILNLFKKQASHDCLVALCAAFSLPLCIWAIINGENIYYLVLLTSITMLTRSIISFMHASTMLSGIKLIKSSKEKYAVSFIKDNSTAVAMAKNAIEGDILIAAPKKAEFISGFMKFSLFKKKFSGKVHIVFITTLVLSILGAFMGYFYYKTVFAAIYAAFAATCVAAMPAVMFVDVLPLFSAAKKLLNKGAMISGTFAADSIELANAAVIETSDIFPDGSVVLKSFKVLSNNNVDKTIVSAAALTEAIRSPLAPIFNKIAGTNTSYIKPDSDTIKYEEKLGLSGWVDNELLFIGNRTLMQAHGIEVPSIELDKKILRSGYFPVYVATGGKACALVIIQYEVRPDIQKLLRQISKLGITMLIKNCDPNVSEEMICDYFGLYDDSVKVMTNVGAHMYDNATIETGVLSAPASFIGSKLNLLHIMLSASKIRISNNILSVFYALASILGIWYFAFTSFAQSSGILQGSAVLLFYILSTVFSLIAFLFRKP